MRRAVIPNGSNLFAQVLFLLFPKETVIIYDYPGTTEYIVRTERGSARVQISDVELFKASGKQQLIDLMLRKLKTPRIERLLPNYVSAYCDWCGRRHGDRGTCDGCGAPSAPDEKWEEIVNA